MYVLGTPTTITVDDIFPLDDDGSSIFASPSRDGALWGMILEKCFAKLHGNYENTIAGDPRHAIEVLSGAPEEDYYHSRTDASTLFNIIS